MSVFRHVFLQGGDVCYFFRGVAVWTVLQCPPHYYTLNVPLRNSNTFLHVIYKSKEKTNLLCILNNVFQYSKIRTRKRNAKKSIKAEINWNPARFGIRNLLSWNPESSTRNPESRGCNPESKTVMDSLTWGDLTDDLLIKSQSDVFYSFRKLRNKITVWYNCGLKHRC